MTKTVTACIVQRLALNCFPKHAGKSNTGIDQRTQFWVMIALSEAFPKVNCCARQPTLGYWVCQLQSNSHST